MNYRIILIGDYDHICTTYQVYVSNIGIYDWSFYGWTIGRLHIQNMFHTFSEKLQADKKCRTSSDIYLRLILSEDSHKHSQEIGLMLYESNFTLYIMQFFYL